MLLSCRIGIFPGKPAYPSQAYPSQAAYPTQGGYPSQPPVYPSQQMSGTPYGVAPGEQPPAYSPAGPTAGAAAPPPVAFPPPGTAATPRHQILLSFISSVLILHQLCCSSAQNISRVPVCVTAGYGMPPQGYAYGPPQPMIQPGTQVIGYGQFDAGARFNSGASANIPVSNDTCM